MKTRIRNAWAVLTGKADVCSHPNVTNVWYADAAPYISWTGSPSFTVTTPTTRP